MNTGARFYNERSCNDDYVPVARFYNERSCNDDYVPVARFYKERSCNDDYVPVPVTRSTGEPNKLEQKYYENAIDLEYNDANIRFGTSTKGGFNFTQSFESDPRLEEIDAKLEADYKTETIFMEMNLSEPEDEERPSFDNKYIRIEDFGILYYHLHTISLFYSRDPVNVFAKTTMSDDDDDHDLDYYEAQEREIDKYETY